MSKEMDELLRDAYKKLELKDVKNRLSSADMSKSIKEATDDELRKIIERLGSEERAQDLIRRLKRQSMSEVERYTQDLAVSTEIPVKDLYHYGVLGMRWGFRKGKKVSGGKTARESKDYKTAKKLKGKRISEMSNEELKTLNSRMQLEKQYKDLNQTKVKKGRKLVTQILGAVGREVATNVIRKQVTAQVEKVMK